VANLHKKYAIFLEAENTNEKLREFAKSPFAKRKFCCKLNTDKRRARKGSVFPFLTFWVDFLGWSGLKGSYEKT
jgi:hypothetical protein